MPEKYDTQTYHIEHILARQHVADNTMKNLALACFRCNGSKGPNIAGYDIVTATLQPLFNPRKNHWSDHFSWNGPIIVPLSAIGRVSVHVLQMNRPNTVRLRAGFMELGEFF